MQILASTLFKLALITLVFHKTIFGQYDVFENFDPEMELPESDLVLLNNAKSMHHTLTPKSAALLSQLSFLSDDEILALGEFAAGRLDNLDDAQRLKSLIDDLWFGGPALDLNGTFTHRINMTEGIQYRWFGALEFDQFTLGWIGERDADEINILDYYSAFLKTSYQDFDYTIGNYQMLLGHGLISWRSMPVKSDFGTINSALRRGRGIQPFRSGHESWGYRGLGWEQPLGKGQLSAGISHRKLDGSLAGNSVQISGSGLHVSESQIKKRGNVSETIGIANWETDIQNGYIGVNVGGGAWADVDYNFTNLVSSTYGSYQVSNWRLFSELATTSRNKNAITGGGKMKRDSFYYGIVFRKIDPDYFALRDNAFRNWNNQELGEKGVLQEFRFRFGKTLWSAYSDMFSRLIKINGEFEKFGHETGISIEHKFNSKLKVQSKLKIQESSSEQYDYTEYQSSSFPVSTFKTTIKWQRSRQQIFQCQIQEKHNQNNGPASLGIQLRNKNSWNRWEINIYWVSVKIKAQNWLYYWDVNLPGEMKSKVFTRSGHYLGSSLSYQTSHRSEIQLRFSTAWKSWDFNVVPIYRGALQINIAI